MNVDDLAGLLAIREARASVALDGETQHASNERHDCCLDHARERIAELEAEVGSLRAWLRECSVAIGGDGSDDSLLGLVYACGAAKEALAKEGR